MEGQLRPELDTSQATPLPAAEAPVVDPIDAALAAHASDARATIAALLQTLELARSDLLTATSALSQGFVRGWTPKTLR